MYCKINFRIINPVKIKLLFIIRFRYLKLSLTIVFTQFPLIYCVYIILVFTALSDTKLRIYSISSSGLWIFLLESGDPVEAERWTKQKYRYFSPFTATVTQYCLYSADFFLTEVVGGPDFHRGRLTLT